MAYGEAVIKRRLRLHLDIMTRKALCLVRFLRDLLLVLTWIISLPNGLGPQQVLNYSYQDANNPVANNSTGSGSLFQLAVNPPTLDSGNRLTNQIKDANGNYGFYNPVNPNVYKFSNPVYTIETNQYKNITNYLLANSSLEATIFPGLRVKTNAGVNVTSFSGSYFQPQDSRANSQVSSAIITKAYYHQNQNNNFEWLWENTIAYDKTFGKHTINFVGGISAQKNTYTANGAGGIPPNSIIRDLGQVTNLQFDQFGNGQTISTLASQFARLNIRIWGQIHIDRHCKKRWFFQI